MCGFPLTIYLLSGWLASHSHNARHLWSDLLGSTGDIHLGLIHIISNVMIPAQGYISSPPHGMCYIMAWNAGEHERKALAKMFNEVLDIEEDWGRKDSGARGRGGPWRAARDHTATSK
jgi:hypothetical protein